MQFVKIRPFFLLLLILVFSKFAFAQCDGVYFKTTKPAIFAGRMDIYEHLPPKDLTGDGKPDLIGVGYNNNTVDKVIVVPADGQGGFNSSLVQIPLPAPTCVCSDNLFVVDFNSDGKNDILVKIDANPTSTLVLRNDGNNTFTPLMLSRLVSLETIQNVVDINNDGIADLLTYLNSGGNTTEFYRFGNANGLFGALVDVASAEYEIGGDFNNDGKIDFPVQDLSAANNHTLRIFYNQGGGIFFLGNNTFNMGATVLRGARDFNNDGKIDLYGVAAGNPFSTLSIIKNLGSDSFSQANYPIPTSPALSFDYDSIGDFNGDGFPDIMFRPFNWSLYSIFTNDGAGAFTRRDYNSSAAGYPFGDLDGDSKTDFVRVNHYLAFQQFGIKLFNENRITVEKNVCDKQGQTKLVDFNRDGVTNRALWRASDGRWRHQQDIFDSVGTSVFWGTNGDVPTPGDFDGDAATDFAVYRPSTGNWYARRSSDNAWYSVQWGIAGDKPAPADYDGDGKTDAAVYRPSDGNWYIFFTGTLQHLIVHFGIAEDKPLPADFDGDGKADLAVFRPSTGVWYYLKSSDANAVAVQWGISTDKPVPADYDGDLKADIAIYRESEGNWYILRSYNSQFALFHFGISGDVPQPGDYNGDGLLDLGIYRPSSRSWYSTDTIYQTMFGEAGEIPVSYVVRVE